MPDRILIALLVPLILLHAGDLVADTFEKIGPPFNAAVNTPVDARGEAMGRAGYVDPRGPTALWWNPAPLLAGTEFSVSYTGWDFYLADFSWQPRAIRLDHRGFSASYLRSRLRWPIFDDDRPEPLTGSFVLDSSVRYSLEQLGLAVDLPRLFGLKIPRLAWSLGMTRKRVGWHPVPTDEWVASLTDWGTSVAWRQPHGAGAWSRLIVTWILRDDMREASGYPDFDDSLAESTIFGLGLEGGIERHGTPGTSLQWLLAYATRRYRDDSFHDHDRDHFGLEITILSTLSLRAGHHRYRSSSLEADDNTTWGAGLQRRIERLGGLQVRLDYAAQDWSARFLPDRHLDHWTLTVSKTME